MKFEARWITILVTVVLLVGAPAFASEFFPVDQVKPGMYGYGRTVIQGSEIESFEVEILGTLEYQGLVDKLILVRVGGELMDKSGGIAQGMSGSPVYIEGKLLGALSYGYGFADHFIGMVTPIEAMLDVLELVPGSKLSLSQPVTLDGQRYDQVVLGASADPGDLEMVPVSTPLLVSGFSSRGKERIKEIFAAQDLPVQSVGTSSDQYSWGPLQPGSPVAVDLVTGDVRVSALGTLTYLDDQGRFLAFGHPFASRGASNYYASRAQILTTVQSVDTPFKIGKPGPSFGVVTQDRQAAIAGRIKEYPRVIPVKVKVKDLDLQRTQDFSFEVIQDPILTLNLIDTAVLQTLDTTLDRIGAGTASVEFQISGDELPAGGFSRKNLFFSSFDIAAISTGELFEALDLVLNNEFKQVDIDQVSATIYVEQTRRTAKIEGAKLLTDQVYPGDTVEVEVTLRPWRNAPLTRVIKLVIPAEIEPGEVNLTVRSASYLGYTEEEKEETELDHPEDQEEPGKPDDPLGIKSKKDEPDTKTNAESLELLISDFVLREKNNQVIAEFYPPIKYAPEEEGEEELPELESTERISEETELHAKPITASLNTEFVIEGSTTLTMEIMAYNPLSGDEVQPEEWSGKSIDLE